MRSPHLSSGGRYPALRAIAVLYLVGVLLVGAFGVWQSIRAFRGANLGTTAVLFGDTVGSWSVSAGLAILGATFVGMLCMFAMAELIKLFIDIEHNTRLAAMRAALGAGSMSDGNGITSHEGRAVPFISDRKLFEGEETAEGALLRGH